MTDARVVRRVVDRNITIRFRIELGGVGKKQVYVAVTPGDINAALGSQRSIGGQSQKGKAVTATEVLGL